MRLKCRVGWLSGLCAAFCCGFLNAQVTVWTNLSGGVWSDAGNWDNGVPDNNMASLTRTTASYIVDVRSAPVAAITNLTVQNTAPWTTLLNVNTGTLAITKGAVFINVGSEVCVKSNACLSFTGGSTTDGQGFFKIQSGGRLRVDGGSVCFTGLTSGARGAIVGYSGAGSVAVTSGVFLLNGGGNPPLHIARGQAANGCFEAAGASRVEVAQLVVGMYGYSHQPASGTLIVRDTSEFTVSAAGSMTVSDETSASALCNTGVVMVAGRATFNHLGALAKIASGSSAYTVTNTGLLQIEADGRFFATNASVYCGHNGARLAAIRVSSNGLLRVKNLYLDGEASMELSGSGLAECGSELRIGNIGTNASVTVADNACLRMGNAAAFRIGYSGGSGTLTLTGAGARLEATNSSLLGCEGSGMARVIVSNGFFTVKNSRLYANSVLTVCGNGCYTGLVSDSLLESDYIGYNTGKTVLNLSDNGRFLTKRNLYIGYYGTEGEVNVSGNGRLSTGCDFVIGFANNSEVKKASVNLSGNGVIEPWPDQGRGLHMAVIGSSSTSVVSNGTVQAWLNISGGLFDMTKNLWQGGPSYEEGIVAGEIWKNNAGSAQAWINLSGGVVTNAGKLMAGMGLGATGVVAQTGGLMNQGVTAAGAFSGMRTVLGWGGGCGEYRLSGGTAVFGGSMYVGGITTNLLGYVPGDTKFTFEPDSAGLLRVEGGTLTVTNSGTLWCGAYGRGTIEIGTGGVCVAKSIVLTNNTQSAVRFELGEDGCGLLRATDSLTVCGGARLAVDARAYRSREARIKLIDFGARTGGFAPENVTVMGAGKVVQDELGVWFYRPRGTVVQLN